MGYSESEEAFREFYDKKEETKPKKKDNDYSNIFEGKNIITIHAESIQQFTLDTFINGEELTPNLNKLAKEGLYFSNFYAQESVGTSSDSEFTFFKFSDAGIKRYCCNKLLGQGLYHDSKYAER